METHQDGEEEDYQITFLEFLCTPLREFIIIIYLNLIPSGETAHPSNEAFRNDQEKKSYMN